MNIKKTPLSELIFDMFLEEDFTSKEKMENYIYARMIRYYKIGISDIDTFVKKEKEHIKLRGTNINSYVFSGTMTLNEILLLLFNNYNDSHEKTDNLMLSELIGISIILKKIKEKYQIFVDNNKIKILNVELEIKKNIKIKSNDAIYMYSERLAQLEDLIEYKEKLNIMIDYLNLLLKYLMERVDNLIIASRIDDIFYDNEVIYNNQKLIATYDEIDLQYDIKDKNIDILTRDINKFIQLGANDMFFNENLCSLLPRKSKKK